MYYSPAYIRGPMWEVDPERLENAMAAAGINQSQLAERVGLKQPSIGRLLSGETKTTRSLDLIARALRVAPGYLRGDIDDPAPSGVVELPVDDPGSVEVHEIDLAYGMGGTYLDDNAVLANTVRFSRDWLRNFTKAGPDQLFFARGSGDSMMPTIADADIVLIDRSQDTLRMRDQIWALTVGGIGMIKRLRPLADGRVAILSDNPSVSEDHAVDDEMFLIGRVVAIVRKV